MCTQEGAGFKLQWQVLRYFKSLKTVGRCTEPYVQKKCLQLCIDKSEGIQLQGGGKIDSVLYLPLNICKKPSKTVKIMGNLCLKNKLKNPQKFAELAK